MSTTVFPVTPARALAFNFIAGIAAIMLISAGAIAFYAHYRMTGLYSAATAEVLAAGLLVHLARSSRRTTVELDDASLRIRGTMFGKTIPRSELLVNEARVVNLQVETVLAPRWRLCGVGLPSYQAGWFTLNGGGKALIFLTDRTQAVHIPTRNGYAVIVNVVKPGEFLQALKRG